MEAKNYFMIFWGVLNNSTYDTMIEIIHIVQLLELAEIPGSVYALVSGHIPPNENGKKPKFRFKTLNFKCE